MCVIIYFRPGQMIAFDKLQNACWNNWHSYGLVTKVDGKLDIKRVVPKSGEVDAKEVEKHLKDDIQYERFLHLRHNTAGATNIENCHPFDIYFNPKSGRQVVFMHNGTLYAYKSKKRNAAGTEVDDDDGPSDTQNFCDQVLIPYLSSTNFGNGAADITHPLTYKLIQKFWSANNRGLLISSDQHPVFIDDWKSLDLNGDPDDKLLCSNDDYFNEVKRGPEKDRRVLREKQREANSKNQAKTSVARSIVPISEFERTTAKPTHPFYQLSTSLANIVNDFDVYDRKHATALGYATREEIEELYKQKTDCIHVMDWIFTDYAKLYQEFLELDEKHKKASNKIAEMVEQQRRAG